MNKENQTNNEQRQITVKELRKFIADLPDDALVFIGEDQSYESCDHTPVGVDWEIVSPLTCMEKWDKEPQVLVLGKGPNEMAIL